MKISQKIATSLAAATVLAGMAAAQSTHQNANRLAADNNFVMKAAQGGLAEVSLGQLAVSHASNDKVRQFGQRMINDHTMANTELKQVASQKGETVPAQLDAKDQATIDKLSQLNGQQFDRAYMNDMVKDHKADVAEFKKEASSGDDPDVKGFASKTLPTLEDHLKMAEEIQGQLK